MSQIWLLAWSYGDKTYHASVTILVGGIALGINLAHLI